jgi:ubiquitin carboxyl-terminal hydrolase 10
VAAKPAKKPTVPAVPIIPALPKTSVRDTPKQATDKAAEEVQPQEPAADVNVEEHKAEEVQAGTTEVETPAPAAAPKAWSAPKTWSGLFNANGTVNTSATSGSGVANIPGNSKANTESLAEALRSFNAVSNDAKVAFLEPRGLINTGNMCYMNSVSLQLIPFVDLD